MGAAMLNVSSKNGNCLNPPLDGVVVSEPGPKHDHEGLELVGAKCKYTCLICKTLLVLFLSYFKLDMDF